MLLSGCHQDGAIAAYRLLKGLVDVGKPAISVTAVDVRELAEAESLYRRLSSVCEQFLNLTLQPEPPLGDAFHIAECPILCCRLDQDKAQLASAGHWQLIAELIAGSQQAASAEPAPAAPAPVPQQEAPMPEPMRIAPVAAPAAVSSPAPHVQSASSSSAAQSDVIDLPDNDGDDAILSALLQHASGELIECPIRPPMASSARLAITRDRRLVLMALGSTTSPICKSSPGPTPGSANPANFWPWLCPSSRSMPTSCPACAS